MITAFLMMFGCVCLVKLVPPGKFLLIVLGLGVVGLVIVFFMSYTIQIVPK